ncbi:hypothetical protein PM082_003520 [Marasmius tenuissimus]|nr:hypothetical protein PM082_003520 [Marasmius tenuissimus]
MEYAWGHRDCIPSVIVSYDIRNTGRTGSWSPKTLIFYESHSMEFIYWTKKSNPARIEIFRRMVRVHGNHYVATYNISHRD